MHLSKIFIAVAVAAGSLGAGQALAQDMSYQPISPSFGGNPFNSSHLLAVANAQDNYKDPDAPAAQTQAQLFAAQLQSRLLSALAGQVTDAIFGDNPQESGTIKFGGQTIDFSRSLDSVTLKLTDETGALTEIVVPTFLSVK